MHPLRHCNYVAIPNKSNLVYLSPLSIHSTFLASSLRHLMAIAVAAVMAIIVIIAVIVIAFYDSNFI